MEMCSDFLASGILRVRRDGISRKKQTGIEIVRNMRNSEPFKKNAKLVLRIICVFQFLEFRMLQENARNDIGTLILKTKVFKQVETWMKIM